MVLFFLPEPSDEIIFWWDTHIHRCCKYCLYNPQSLNRLLSRYLLYFGIWNNSYHFVYNDGKVIQSRAIWKSKRVSKTRLFSIKRLGEVRSNLKCTSPNRLLLSNQDKGSTPIGPSLVHSLALPHDPGLLNVSNVSNPLS